MGQIRKVAANYIYLPNSPLVKNGYVEISKTQGVKAVDTGGEIKEIAGLEFYGGMIVPDYVREYAASFLPEMALLPRLEQLFDMEKRDFSAVAIIEGADLLRMVWTKEAKIRLL